MIIKKKKEKKKNTHTHTHTHEKTQHKEQKTLNKIWIVKNVLG